MSLGRWRSVFSSRLLGGILPAATSSPYHCSSISCRRVLPDLPEMCSDVPGTSRNFSRSFSRDSSGTTLQAALAGNRRWAAEQHTKDPTFFDKLAQDQHPEWLWIGCSDSRVPANELMGMGPGEVFVQRNVGNLATHKDMNVMSCLEYAVSALKVKYVIVCGHYGCGAVKAALELPCKSSGLVNLWIQDIRDVRDHNVDTLRAITTQEARVNRLVELNVMRQVFNVCTSPVVQQAWDNGQPLAVHGLVYDLKDGLLRELTNPITCLDDIDHYVSELEGGSDKGAMCRAVLTHMSFEREALDKEHAAEAAAKKDAANETVVATVAA